MRKILTALFLVFFVNAFAVRITLNLKKGDEFEISIKSEQLIRLGESGSVFTTKTSIDSIWNLKVLNLDKETMEIAFQLQKTYIKVSSQSGIKEFNTEKVEKYPSNPTLAMIMEFKNTPLIYVFSRKNFQVVKVKNLDVVFKNVLEKLKIKDERLKKDVLKKLKEQSKMYDNGYIFGSNMAAYLNKDIEMGKSFDVKQEFAQGGIKFKVNLTFTPKKIDDDFVYFKLSSVFKIPFQEMTVAGSKFVMNMEGTQDGDLTVYRGYGLPKFFSVKQKLKGSMAQKGAGDGFPMSIDSVFVVRYEKVK